MSDSSSINSSTSSVHDSSSIKLVVLCDSTSTNSVYDSSSINTSDM